MYRILAYFHDPHQSNADSVRTTPEEQSTAFKVPHQPILPYMIEPPRDPVGSEE